MSGAELYLVAALVSAGATYMQSKNESNRLKAAANQKEIQGRVDFINNKRQGVQVLKETNKVIAANIAKAGAGNLDPYASGESPDIVIGYSLKEGINDFTIARNNAAMAIKMSKYEADSLRSAAKTTEKTGMLTAIAQVGMGVYGYNTIGSAPTTTASTSNKFLNTTYSDFGSKRIVGQTAYNRYLPGVT